MSARAILNKVNVRDKNRNLLGLTIQYFIPYSVVPFSYPLPENRGFDLTDFTIWIPTDFKSNSILRESTA